MECYIVRIYQREQDDPSKIAGTVEEAGCQEQRPFTDIDELFNIFRMGGLSDKKRPEPRS